MIDPMRGTKLSIFLPWDKSQYAILDLPEALFLSIGSHVPWPYACADYLG